MNNKFRISTKVLLAASFILAPLASSAAEMTDIGTLPGSTRSWWPRISGDGKVVYGTSGNPERIFRYKNGVISDMGSLGGIYTEVHGISYDGSIAVGMALDGSGNTKGFKIVNGVMTATDDYVLGGGISNDGLVVAGSRTLGVYLGAIIQQAIKVENGVVTDLGNFGVNNSFAGAVSGDGKVIVGTGNGQAFKYINGSIINLGTLGGTWSEAHSVSYDGAIIVGDSDKGSNTKGAYKYANGVMTDIGTLGGPSASAYAISQNGKVIVGESSTSIATVSTPHAFKYVDGVMTDLGTLGGTTSAATGVSANGLVIVGWSTIAGDTDQHAFIYNDFGMIDVPSWMESVTGAYTVNSISLNLVSSFLEGAHHRPLMDFDHMLNKSSVWVTGDFSSGGGSTSHNASSGEIGFSTKLGRNCEGGLAVGTGSQNQDLSSQGHTDVSGKYLLAEIDYKYNKVILSGLIAYGDWNADIYRGYNVGGSIDYSTGATSVKTLTLRLRADSTGIKLNNKLMLSPYASFNLTNSKTAAYTEQGGSLPAYFDQSSQTISEARLGAALKMPISRDTLFILSAELIQRLDNTSSTISGSDVSGIIPFNISSDSQDKTRARIGLDLDQKLSKNTLLNFSLHLASGLNSVVSGAVSIRQSF
jgi:probable HAF family extracellular repeat protein